MRFEMVDGDERLADRERDSLSRHQSDNDPSDEAGPRGGCDAIKVPDGRPRVRKRPRDQRVDDLDMGARRDFRHDAAKGCVRRDLAHHFIGQDLP